MREMRRTAQHLPEEEIYEILKTCKTMTLALEGDEGYPYSVPVNFAYHDGKIDFHCAVEGHKIDAIRRNPKVSASIIAREDVMASERTTYYQSVILFGTARILENPEEMAASAKRIGDKYSKGYEADCDAEIEDTLRKGTLCCVEITIDHITGKESRTLAKLRKQKQLL